MRTLAGFLFRGLKRTDRNNISKDCFGVYYIKKPERTGNSGPAKYNILPG
jgi:hypothetical protein